MTSSSPVTCDSIHGYSSHRSLALPSKNLAHRSAMMLASCRGVVPGGGGKKRHRGRMYRHRGGRSSSRSATACVRMGVRTDATAGHAARGNRGIERDWTSWRAGWERESVARKCALAATGSGSTVCLGWWARGVVRGPGSGGVRVLSPGAVGGGGVSLSDVAAARLPTCK